MMQERLMQEMHRGYARNGREEAILAANGIKTREIYLEGRGAETLATVHLRKGDELHTVNGLRALGNNRDDIVSAVEHIHKLGAVVVDAETGQRSDRDGVAMFDRALARIRGEKIMPPGQARRMALASAKAKVSDRMSKREALVHWRNPNLTTGEAIRLMKGWAQRTAYNEFGPRGLPRGRRSN